MVPPGIGRTFILMVVMILLLDLAIDLLMVAVGYLLVRW